jgi:hypothetical protein
VGRLTGIETVLLDLDGTLYVAARSCPAWPGPASRPPSTSWSPRSRWLSGCLRRHRRRGCWPAAWPGRATGSPTCWSPNPGYGATSDELDPAFGAVRAGAELVATRSTGSPARDDGEDLDTGGWVRLLEYATGERARVLGKPSPEFFTAPLDALGRGPETALVVGDDLEATSSSTRL